MTAVADVVSLDQVVLPQEMLQGYVPLRLVWRSAVGVNRSNGEAGRKGRRERGTQGRQGNNWKHSVSEIDSRQVAAFVIRERC